MERLVYVIFLSVLCCGVLAQYKEDNVKLAATSLDYFALNILAELAEHSGTQLNIAVAPYILWSMLGLINEGAKNRTERQITEALHIPKNIFKDAYRQINANITARQEGVDLILSNVIFILESERPRINRDFENVAANYYGVNVITQDFNQTESALYNMNKIMSAASRNKIENFFIPEDLKDAFILLGCAFYFKGAWTKPFNASKTTSEVFYDENNKAIGYVDMMQQLGPFSYSTISSLSSLAVELPYGKEERMSMILLLPKKGTSLNKVLRILSEKKLDEVIYLLDKAGHDYADEEVNIMLPKFKIHSDFVLNAVLHKMGISDLFNSQDADLTGVAHNYLYVSRLVQKAVIEVDEQGTEAAAVAGASFINKSPPPNFRADRPFAYFIVDKPTKSILFAGKFTKPDA